jgi:hypothetical protein
MTQDDPIPSWNDGPAKQAIVDFVRATTDRSSPQFVPPEERIATFDQDGTLLVEHPMYTQVVYCLERVAAVVAKKPQLQSVEPFKTVLSGNKEAISRLSMQDLEKILTATLSGMSVENFEVEVKKWFETARHPRWNRPYTDLVYQPMLEVVHYLRGSAYKTYIVTGGGQDFVRAYAEKVYGIAPEQVDSPPVSRRCTVRLVTPAASASSMMVRSARARAAVSWRPSKVDMGCSTLNRHGPP